MAIDFPDLPSLNQEYTVGNRTWIWTGTVWQAKSRDILGLIDDAVIEANDYTDNAIAIHANVTANVHGIANTLALATLSDLSTKQDIVANVSSTEIGYLDGVTSSIQTQINGKAASIHTHAISDVTDLSTTLSGKANTSHTHAISDVTDLSNTLSNKANATHTHAISDITDLSNTLSNKANSTHSHAISDITDLSTTLSGKSNTGHLHVITDIANVTASVEEINILDGLLATTTELNYIDGVTSNVQAQLDGKANSSHTHSITDISNITASTSEINILDGATISTSELNYLDGVTSNVQAQIDGKANSGHTHAITDIANITASASEINVLDGITVSTTELNYVDGVTSNIQLQLNDKASATHTHTISDISNVTASTDEINILDGATITTSELNYLDGVTSNVQLQIDGKASLSGATFTGFITLHADPEQANHAVNKAYVDNIAAGLHIHEAAHVATTDTLANLCSANVTYNNGTDGVGATLSLGAALTTIDGHTLSNDDRILVKNESNAAHNGIYVRTSSTLLTRAADFNTALEIAGGDFVFVENGTLYNSTAWVVENEVNTIGTDAVTWLQFSGSGGAPQAGNNIAVNGYQISVVSDPSFANLTVTSSVNFSNASITGIELNDIANVITNTNTAGDVLYWDGTNWINKYINAIPGIASSSAVTAYTLVLSDNGKMLEFSNSSAITVTVPADTSANFPTGSQVNIVQVGAGQVTVQGDTGVTVNYTPGNKLRAQWSVATLVKRSANTWLLYGDLVL